MNNNYNVKYNNTTKGRNKMTFKEIADYYNIDCPSLMNNYYTTKDIKKSIIKTIDDKEKKEMILKYLYDFGLENVLNKDQILLAEVYDKVASKLAKSQKYEKYERILEYYRRIKSLKEENMNKIKYDNTNENYKILNDTELELLIVNTDEELSNINTINEYSKETEKLFRLFINLLTGNYEFYLESALNLIIPITNDEKEALKIISKAIDENVLILTNEQFKKLCILINGGYPSNNFNKEIINDLINKEYNNLYKNENTNVKTR